MVTGRIIQRDDPDFPKLSALYREAFPENERLSDGVYLYEESSGTFKKAEAGSNVLN